MDEYKKAKAIVVGSIPTQIQFPSGDGFRKEALHVSPGKIVSVTKAEFDFINGDEKTHCNVRLHVGETFEVKTKSDSKEKKAVKQPAKTETKEKEKAADSK